MKNILIQISVYDNLKKSQSYGKLKLSSNLKYSTKRHHKITKLHQFKPLSNHLNSFCFIKVFR